MNKLEVNAKDRLTRELLVREIKEKQFLQTADLFVGNILQDLDGVMGDRKSVDRNSTEDMTIDNTSYLMTAVHLLISSGSEIDYSPIINGKRQIRTRDKDRLMVVKNIFETAEQDVKKRIEPYGNFTGLVMGEVVSSIFSTLRDRRETKSNNSVAFETVVFEKVSA